MITPKAYTEVNTAIFLEQNIILGPWLSAVVVTAIYWQTNPIAGMVLSFSCVWLTVAAVLVFRIWQLNGCEPLYPLKLTSVENK